MRLATASAAALLAASCASPPPPQPARTPEQVLLGQWDCTPPDGDADVKMLMTFSEGRRIRLSVAGELEDDGSATADISAEGGFALDGDALNVSDMKVKVNALTIGGEPVDWSALGGKEAFEQMMTESLGASEPAQVLQLDEHTLRIAGFEMSPGDDGDALTCRR